MAEHSTTCSPTTPAPGFWDFSAWGRRGAPWVGGLFKIAGTIVCRLKRYRSKGKQRVYVKRVNVEKGRQAIVGTIERKADGGGMPTENDNNPMSAANSTPRCHARSKRTGQQCKARLFGVDGVPSSRRRRRSLKAQGARPVSSWPAHHRGQRRANPAVALDELGSSAIYDRRWTPTALK